MFLGGVAIAALLFMEHLCLTFSDERGGTRCSNIEILRIIATFFILLIHANFRFLGEPTIDNMRVTLSMHGVEHYLKL